MVLAVTIHDLFSGTSEKLKALKKGIPVGIPFYFSNEVELFYSHFHDDFM